MDVLIQTIDGVLADDFTWITSRLMQLREFLGYQDTVAYSEKPEIQSKDQVPVGTVEFVESCLQTLGIPTPTPRNVPISLRPYAGRGIINSDHTFERPYEMFVKSNDTIKRFETAIYPPYEKLPPGNYQFSKVVEFISEWRAFIWRGELVGLKHYLGDFCVFPETQTLQSMIDVFNNSGNAPCAYTLDIGIQYDWRTSVIEVHDFFSCGLYGFDSTNVPLMLAGWWKEYVRNND